MDYLGWINRSILLLALCWNAVGMCFANINCSSDDLVIEHENPFYQKHYFTRETPWLDAQKNGSIVYFLFDSDSRIERFDIETETWIDPILLEETPTAFTVDNDGIYISFGRSTSRFDLEGDNEVHLKDINHDVQTLMTLDNYLYLHYSDTVININKITGTYYDDCEFWYNMQGLDVAPSKWAIFARSLNVSPSDIVKISLNSDGSIGTQEDSPYHGAYPSATDTYVFPDGSRVADNSGIVYNTNNLTYSNSLAGAFDDLAFYHEFPIVLRGEKLYAYSGTFLETGQCTLYHSSLRIFIVGENIYSFFEEAGKIGVEITPVELLNPPEPGEPVDPDGLAYTPDAIYKSQDNILYILSRGNLSIFRYSISKQDYLTTIPLIEAPNFMAFSQKTNRLYLSYPEGKISRINLNQSLSEKPFVNSPLTPLGISTAGEFLFVCDSSGAWDSHFTYSPHGELISQVEWSYYSSEFVWCEANRNMYYFRDNSSPNDILYEYIDENGEIGNEKDSPYHGTYSMRHPIRVAPDGSIVVTGSGQIFDATSLEAIDALSNEITDAIWTGGFLYTSRNAIADCQIQKWNSNYGIAIAKDFPGEPVRLFPLVDGLLCITSIDGVPTFYYLDSDLENLEDSLKVDLSLSKTIFMPGDSFVLKADVTNPGPDTYENLPFVVMLEVYGMYYFHPYWSEAYSHQAITLGIGTQSMEILNFIWPEIDLTAYDFKFYGALLNSELSNIMGFYDVITFGCESY